MKICTSKTCHKSDELQPLDNFYRRNGTKERVSECKYCANVRGKALRLKAAKPKVKRERESVREAKEAKLFNSLNVAW